MNSEFFMFAYETKLVPSDVSHHMQCVRYAHMWRLKEGAEPVNLIHIGAYNPHHANPTFLRYAPYGMPV